MKKIIILICALLAPLSTLAAPRADALVSRAFDMGLADKPEWRALLHYNTNKSVITDPEFWLSEQGATDPAKELEATIRAFFEPSRPTQRIEREFKNGYKATMLKQHPLCMFPARLDFLERHLDTWFPRPSCTDYEMWRARMAGESLSVIFASNTLNNPSSMFGHTFIKIDQEGNALGSQTVNFAAITPDNEMGLLFAMQGFTGGYPGVWTFAPYYEKIKTYGTIDNRNLQEFRLKVPMERVDFFKKHLWELSYIYADYYFLNVNCSAAVIDLLRVVNPLIEENNSAAIFPTNVLRTLRPMIEEGALRPSLQNKIVHRYRQMTDEERAGAKKFTGLESLSALPPQSQSRVLELLFDANQYDLAHGRIGEEEMRTKGFELLSSRRAVRIKPQWDDEVPLEPAYDSHRIVSAWTGVNTDRFGTRATAGFAPIYHRFMDDDFGMNKWSEIKAFDFAASFGTDGFNMEHLTFVSLKSMNPDIAMFNNYSWDASIGVESFMNSKTWTRDGYIPTLTASLGKSYYLFPFANNKVPFAGEGVDGAAGRGSGDNNNDLIYIMPTTTLNTRFQSLGLKLALATYLFPANGGGVDAERTGWLEPPTSKNHLSLFANYATNQFSSAGISNTYAYFLTRNSRIEAAVSAEYFYELSRLNYSASLSLQQHF
ncbi:MAG: DUF4105 domain-containing protein [Rickettsiales bacterium]|jgi:hypothetical protein|nr:DUF4105 domain-containing protein [Rickettsiales bacterium]